MKEQERRRPKNHLVWVGAAVSLVALISYFAFFARFPAVRDTPWVNLPGVLLGFGISVAAVVRRRSAWSISGLALSLACAAALVGYVYVLSYQLPETEDVVAVGAVAPSFELLDQAGRAVRLQDFAGSSVVLVFYRGFW